MTADFIQDCYDGRYKFLKVSEVKVENIMERQRTPLRLDKLHAPSTEEKVTFLTEINVVVNKPNILSEKEKFLEDFLLCKTKPVEEKKRSIEFKCPGDYCNYEDYEFVPGYLSEVIGSIKKAENKNQLSHDSTISEKRQEEIMTQKDS
jgi:hypothetical protein